MRGDELMTEVFSALAKKVTEEVFDLFSDGKYDAACDLARVGIVVFTDFLKVDGGSDCSSADEHQGSDSSSNSDILGVGIERGSCVRISGLVGAAQLNGLEGIADSFDQTTGRWAVKLSSGSVKAVKVKPGNLSVIRRKSKCPRVLFPHIPRGCRGDSFILVRFPPRDHPEKLAKAAQCLTAYSFLLELHEPYSWLQQGYGIVRGRMEQVRVGFSRHHASSASHPLCHHVHPPYISHSHTAHVGGEEYGPSYELQDPRKIPNFKVTCAVSCPNGRKLRVRDLVEQNNVVFKFVQAMVRVAAWTRLDEHELFAESRRYYFPDHEDERSGAIDEKIKDSAGEEQTTAPSFRPSVHAASVSGDFHLIPCSGAEATTSQFSLLSSTKRHREEALPPLCLVADLFVYETLWEAVSLVRAVLVQDVDFSSLGKDMVDALQNMMKMTGDESRLFEKIRKHKDLAQFNGRLKVLLEWTLQLDFVFSCFGLGPATPEHAVLRKFGGDLQSPGAICYFLAQFHHMSVLRDVLCTYLTYTGPVEEFGSALTIVHAGCCLLKDFGMNRARQPIQSSSPRSYLDALCNSWPELKGEHICRWGVFLGRVVVQYTDPPSPPRQHEDATTQRCTGVWILFHQLRTYGPVVLSRAASPFDGLAQLRSAVQDREPLPRQYDQLHANFVESDFNLQIMRNARAKERTLEQMKRDGPKEMPIDDPFLFTAVQILDTLLTLGVLQAGGISAKIESSRGEDIFSSAEKQASVPPTSLATVAAGLVDQPTLVASRTLLENDGGSEGLNVAKKSKNKRKKRQAAAQQASEMNAKFGLVAWPEHLCGSGSKAKEGGVAAEPASEDLKRLLRDCAAAVFAAPAAADTAPTHSSTVSGSSPRAAPVARQTDPPVADKATLLRQARERFGKEVREKLFVGSCRVAVREGRVLEKILALSVSARRQLAELLSEKRTLVRRLVHIYERVVNSFCKIGHDEPCWRYTSIGACRDTPEVLQSLKRAVATKFPFDMQDDIFCTQLLFDLLRLEQLQSNLSKLLQPVFGGNMPTKMEVSSAGAQAAGQRHLEDLQALANWLGVEAPKLCVGEPMTYAG